MPWVSALLSTIPGLVGRCAGACRNALIPDIRVVVKAGAGGSMEYAGAAGAAIRLVSRVRLGCKILADLPVDRATADLRLGRPSGASVPSSPKAIDADGCASLILPDDAHEVAAAGHRRHRPRPSRPGAYGPPARETLQQ